jgi:DNA-binding transcriptional MerR regulator
MYTIQDISKITGLTKRTLRHYEDEHLIHPQRKENNYRIYTQHDLNQIQSILFYRSLGYDLNQIYRILYSPNYDILSSLQTLFNEVTHKIDYYKNIQALITKTIQNHKGEITMSNDEKFEALKEKQIKENQEKYGEELNEKYGQALVEEVNHHYKKKSKYQMKEQEERTIALHKQMIQALKTNDPKSQDAKLMCELHKEWLCFYWPRYDQSAHLNLVKMYTEDSRFKAHYEKIKPGLTDFLYQAMTHYIEKDTD